MYLLDANVFITAKNAYYGMDFAPGFWSWLSDAHDVGKVYTVQAVRDELVGSEDELAEWIKQQPKTFFETPGSEAIEKMAELSGWCTSEARYTQAARTTFLSSADFFLVAQAAALGFTVVTHERSEPESKKIVKIPDACLALGVPYMSPWKMLRDEGAKFVT